MIKQKRGIGHKAQISVFIILAIVIVLIIIVLVSRTDLKTIFIGKTPVQQIEDCVSDNIEEGLNILKLQGGSIEPSNYYLYKGNKVEYVCYTEEILRRCVMQKPLLKNSISDELKKYSEPKINTCLQNIKSRLEKKGYDVNMKKPEVSIDIIPDNVLTEVDLDLSISKDGTESYKRINIGTKSKLYNFVMIASSIMSWETRFGDSETMNYMLHYPSIKVEKKKQGDETKIYIITDRDTQEKFMFAIKSMPLPIGIVGEIR